jgi:hypothetical protein
VDAWIGVVGTLLGTIVGAAVTFLIERDRRRNEDRHRFAEVKRSLYADYYRETQSTGLDLVERMHELQRVFEGAMDPSEVRRIAALDGIFRLGDQIISVAPDEVYDAANRLSSAILSFRELAAKDPATLTASPWEAGDSSRMWDAHDAFITLARKDLGVGHRPISNA